MREIKFRIWDIKRRDWISEQKCNESDIVTIGLDGSVRGQYYSDHSIYPKEDYTLQQFTGLKDKNGKEIYEGDIVKIYAIKSPLDIYQVSEVGFDDGFFFFGVKIPLCQAALNPDSRCEVVGNIFENSELLNGSK